MEISRCFLDILKSIDYHVGHLPRDLFVNEERLPELQPIFTWLINNVTPKSNCVTPRELALYTSISSKHDNFSSLEKVLKGIDKFYDKSTKDSKVCSADLETLERKILKSQQELNDLKAYKIVFEKKTHLMNDEISLLKQKENSISKTCYKTENNLSSTVKTFIEAVDNFGSNVNKLHVHVTKSMTDDDICLTKLASRFLIDVTDLWRQNILLMIDLWFNKKTNSTVKDSTCPTQIHTLSLLLQSVTALRISEINEKCEITKLNIAVNSLLSIQNYCYEDNKCLQSNGLNITNYLAKYVTQREVAIDNSQHLSSTEYDYLQSCISNTVITDAKKKLSVLESIDYRITLIQDSIEHYILICDVLWCLMRTGYSMANFKCELVFHCMKFIEKMYDEMSYAEQWSSNYAETNALQSSHVKKANFTTFQPNVVKFDKYKHTSKMYTDSDEIDKLSKMVQQWKSKYHYTREECSKLTILQRKLHEYGDSLNELMRKHSSATM